MIAVEIAQTVYHRLLAICLFSAALLNTAFCILLFLPWSLSLSCRGPVVEYKKEMKWPAWPWGENLGCIRIYRSSSAMLLSLSLSAAKYCGAAGFITIPEWTPPEGNSWWKLHNFLGASGAPALNSSSLWTLANLMIEHFKDTALRNCIRSHSMWSCHFFLGNAVELQFCPDISLRSSSRIVLSQLQTLVALLSWSMMRRCNQRQSTSRNSVWEKQNCGF